MKKADILICGAGIIGLTIARRLLFEGCENIIIIEKESRLGMHASGRNSGVLHAGIYYAPETFKARFCLEGNKLMKQYCKEKGITLLETGKVIVAKNADEAETIKMLYERAKANGAKVELVDEIGLKKYEPHAKTCKTALFSHYTAVVDYKAVLQTLYEDLIASNKVQILTETKFLRIKGNSCVLTSQGDIHYDTFINAAGAYSDRIAHLFGVGLNYVLIPFKGHYKKLKKEKTHLVNGNIYPVPDIRNPFLGTHLTKSTNGDVLIGPTAIPAFGRENYGLFSGLDSEVFKILYEDMILFFVNKKFRRVAQTEPKKYIFRYFFKDVEKLISDVTPADIEPAVKVGIRPQLVDWPSKELVMDFKVIKEDNHIHILNAISPAFTSSMAFANYVVNEYVKKR